MSSAVCKLISSLIIPHLGVKSKKPRFRGVLVLRMGEPVKSIGNDLTGSPVLMMGLQHRNITDNILEFVGCPYHVAVTPLSTFSISIK